MIRFELIYLFHENKILTIILHKYNVNEIGYMIYTNNKIYINKYVIEIGNIIYHPNIIR